MIVASSEPASDYSAAYYDPPRIRWWALFIVFTVAGLVASVLVKNEYRNLVNELVFDAWGIYVCLWIRRIEPQSKSLLWFSASAAAGVLTSITGFTGSEYLAQTFVSINLGLINLALYFVAIFVIRAELVRHYNRREDFTLILGPIMTFFFSFLYFQYHLSDIADQRLKERSSLTV